VASFNFPLFFTLEIIRQDLLRIKKGRAIADPALWFASEVFL